MQAETHRALGLVLTTILGTYCGSRESEGLNQKDWISLVCKLVQRAA